ncbi:NADAR family protein [Tahibacter caeni]|uniref:NADAR family protein n=1 Tax=Tahibacter caeni TaxID=1453545 RepID=UPI0021496B90|nr:NADAR family protein [Tahibacter caeni]
MSDEQEPIYFYTRAMAYWGLSNFAPPGVALDGIYWPTVEHYFQALKFLDAAHRTRIHRAPTPHEARTLGQSRSLPIRHDWDVQRDAIMLEALRAKFRQPDARRLLLSTRQRMLVEASPYDYYWGAGQDGSGKNRLGELLMQVRAEAQADT